MADPKLKKFRVCFVITCHSYWTFMHVVRWAERILCTRELATLKIEEIE